MHQVESDNTDCEIESGRRQDVSNTFSSVEEREELDERYCRVGMLEQELTFEFDLWTTQVVHG